jgi:hypothetical protein
MLSGCRDSGSWRSLPIYVPARGLDSCCSPAAVAAPPVTDGASERAHRSAKETQPNDPRRGGLVITGWQLVHARGVHPDGRGVRTPSCEWHCPPLAAFPGGRTVRHVRQAARPGELLKNFPRRLHECRKAELRCHKAPGGRLALCARPITGKVRGDREPWARDRFPGRLDTSIRSVSHPVRRDPNTLHSVRAHILRQEFMVTAPGVASGLDCGTARDERRPA